eukprot:270692-Pelagomonas_calceolata.AAC.1
MAYKAWEQASTALSQTAKLVLILKVLEAPTPYVELRYAPKGIADALIYKRRLRSTGLASSQAGQAVIVITRVCNDESALHMPGHLVCPCPALFLSCAVQPCQLSSNSPQATTAKQASAMVQLTHIESAYQHAAQAEYSALFPSPHFLMVPFKKEEENYVGKKKEKKNYVGRGNSPYIN